jgi:hypothetical protein
MLFVFQRFHQNDKGYHQGYHACGKKEMLQHDPKRVFQVEQLDEMGERQQYDCKGDEGKRPEVDSTENFFYLEGVVQRD